MILIQGGTFLIGSPASDAKFPFPDFSIGLTSDGGDDLNARIAEWLKAGGM